MTQASEEIEDETNQSKVLEFIQDIVANKFPKLSKKDIEAMLKISDETKKTGYNKSVKEEVLSEVIQNLLQRGDSIEEIAKTLKIDVEEARKLANQDK